MKILFLALAAIAVLANAAILCSSYLGLGHAHYASRQAIDISLAAANGTTANQTGTTTATTTTTSATTSTTSTAPPANAPAVYNVTFYESGLPSNATWTVKFGNASAQFPAPEPIIFRVYDGTYSFFVSYSTANSVVFSPLPENDSVTVNGPASYLISFGQQNATSTTTATTTTSASTSAASTAASTSSTSVQSSSSSAATTQATSQTTTALTSTSSTSQTTAATTTTVATVQGMVNTTVREVGLPKNTTWYISYGAAQLSSATNAMEVQTQGGTYNLIVKNATANGVAFAPNVSSGSFAAGSNILLLFSRVGAGTSGTTTTIASTTSSTSSSTTISSSTTTVPQWTGSTNGLYNVTFYEMGLPGNTPWTATIANAHASAVAPDQIVFILRNGTYSFNMGNATSVNGTFAPNPGNATITVNSSSSYIVRFSQKPNYTSQRVNVSQVIDGLEAGLNLSAPMYPNKGQRYTYMPERLAVIPMPTNTAVNGWLLNVPAASLNSERAIVVAGNTPANPTGFRVLNTSIMYANEGNETLTYAQNLSAGVTTPILYGDTNSMLRGLYLDAKSNTRSAYAKIAYSGLPQNNAAPPQTPVYSYFTVNSTVPDSNITNATYTFSVSRQWVENEGEFPQQVTLLKYVNGGWINLPTALENASPEAFVFNASSSSLSSYAVSFEANGVIYGSPYTTNGVLNFKKGYSTYFAACATGGYTIPATSFSTTVNSAYYSGCGGYCAEGGYQTSNTVWCQQSNLWYFVFAGIGANVIIKNGNVFGAVNTTTNPNGESVYLTYKVGAANSFVVLTGACGWENCHVQLPTGCMAQTTGINASGQDSAIAATCAQGTGTYTANLIDANPGTNTGQGPAIGVFEAYVFPSYNVLLETSPATAKIQTNNNIEYSNDVVMNVIGVNPLNAIAPSSGTWQFVNWVSSDATNIIIANTIAQDTFATVEGDGNIIASFNGITTFSETGLPSGSAWNVLYNGNMISSNSNAITFNFAPGAYSYTIANQVISGNTYVPFPATGTADSGNSISVSFSKLGSFTLSLVSNTPTYDQSDAVTVTAGNPANTVEILIGAGSGSGTSVASGTGSATCDVESTCNPDGSGEPMAAGTWNVVGYDVTSGAHTPSNSLVIGKATPAMSLDSPGNIVYTGAGGTFSFSITTYNSQIAGNMYVNNALEVTTNTESTFTTSPDLNTYDGVFNTLGNGNYLTASVSNSFTISSAPFTVDFTSTANALIGAATVYATLPGGFSQYYCNAGTFTTFSSYNGVSWETDVNETGNGSPPNGISVGHQSSSTCISNAIGAGGTAGTTVAGIGVNQINYQVITSKAAAITSNTVDFSVGVSNSFVIIQAPTGVNEAQTVSLPANCVQQQMLIDDSAGSPGATSYIATCSNMASGSYSLSWTLRGSGSVADAVYIFPPFKVTLNSVPSTANIETNNNIYANGLTMNVIGAGTIQTIAPSDSSNYVWVGWTVNNAINLTVFNSIAELTTLNVAGNGILTANYNGVVNFVESGLPAGTTWNVVYNGQLLSSSGTTITFNDVIGPSYSYTIANQIASGNLYGTTHIHGSSVAPNTIDVQFVTGCAIFLAPNTLDFGNIEPGANVPADFAVTDNNLGPVVANILVSGTNWIDGSNSYFTANTVFNAISQSSYVGIPLPLFQTTIDTMDQITGFFSLGVYFGTAVPPSEERGSYTQNIIIENSC